MLIDKSNTALIPRPSNENEEPYGDEDEDQELFDVIPLNEE